METKNIKYLGTGIVIGALIVYFLHKSMAHNGKPAFIQGGEPGMQPNK